MTKRSRTSKDDVLADIDKGSGRSRTGVDELLAAEDGDAEDI